MLDDTIAENGDEGVVEDEDDGEYQELNSVEKSEFSKLLFGVYIVIPIQLDDTYNIELH